MIIYVYVFIYIYNAIHPPLSLGTAVPARVGVLLTVASSFCFVLVLFSTVHLDRSKSDRSEVSYMTGQGTMSINIKLRTMSV